MISEVETMWKEKDVAGFKISSLCDIGLILPQNTYTKHVHIPMGSILIVYIFILIYCMPFLPYFLISYLILHSTCYILSMSAYFHNILIS